jgi:uncharacterized integral membrane protein
MSETGPTSEPPRTGPATEGEAPPADRAVEPASPEPPSSAGPDDPLRGSRTSGLWTAVIALVLLLVLLAVFVFQNTQQVRVTYFGWDVEAPLSAALLVATAAGGLIVVAAGSLRILQLRRRVRRESKLRRRGRRR